MGNQGGAWESVLPGRGPEAGPEVARRDAALGVRRYDAVAAIDSWPQRERTSLDRARRIHIGTRPDGVLFFRPPPVRRDWWW